MFKRLVPGKSNEDNIATPRYFLHVEEDSKAISLKFLRAIESQKLIFVTKEKMGIIDVDVEISFDEKTCICIPREEVLGAVTGRCDTVFSFPDRVLIVQDNGLLIAIHIGDSNV